MSTSYWKSDVKGQDFFQHTSIQYEEFAMVIYHNQDVAALKCRADSSLPLKYFQDVM